MDENRDHAFKAKGKLEPIWEAKRSTPPPLPSCPVPPSKARSRTSPAAMQFVAFSLAMILGLLLSFFGWRYFPWFDNKGNLAGLNAFAILFVKFSLVGVALKYRRTGFAVGMLVSTAVAILIGGALATVASLCANSMKGL